MKEYIKTLYDEMYTVMERPVTLGRVEEVGEYADTICKLEKLHRHTGTHEAEFTQKDAREWTQRMENEDGTTGAHWTMAQTEAVAENIGLPQEIPRWAFGVAMNMMYSDYYGVAQQFGINRPEFYAELAKAFLYDRDGPGPEKKLMRYYEKVVQ